MRDCNELSEDIAFELASEGQEVASHQFSGKSTPARANQAKAKAKIRQECSWHHCEQLSGEWPEIRLEGEAESKVLSRKIYNVMGRYWSILCRRVT